MSYVVNGNCLGCRYTDCVEKCPVKDCFKIGKNMVVIDPQLCIDCGECVSACPVEAIAHDSKSDLKWIEHNGVFSSIWPAINQAIEPLPCAADAENQTNKEEVYDKEAF